MGHIKDWLLLSLLIAAVLIGHFWWLHADTRPQPGFDSNAYLEKGLQFLDYVSSGKLTVADATQAISRQGRPPFFTILSLPFVLILGRSADSALALNAVFYIMIIVSTYAIGRITFSGNAGLLAAFTVATMPPVVNMSRLFLPHFATIAIVALTVALLQYMLKTRTALSAWLFGASLGVAGLVHPKALFFLLPPTVVLGLYALLFQSQPRFPANARSLGHWLLTKLRVRFVLYGLLPAAVIGFVIAAAWYLPNLSLILDQTGRSLDRWYDVTHGFGGTTRSILWFIQTSPFALSWPYAILIGVSIIIILLVRKELMVTLLVTFALTYIAQSSTPGAFVWFNASAMLPVAAAVVGVGVFAVTEAQFLVNYGHQLNRGLTTLLVAITLITGLFCYATASFPIGAAGTRLAQLLGSQVDGSACENRISTAFCPNPPQGGNWAYADIIETIVTGEECPGEKCTLVVEGRWTAPYEYSMIRDYSDRVVRVFAVTNAFRRLNGLKSLNYLAGDYVVYNPDIEVPPDTIYALRELLYAPEAPFTDIYPTVAEFRLPDGTSRVLAKRTHAITQDERLLIAFYDLHYSDGRMAGVIQERVDTIVDQLIERYPDVDDALEAIKPFFADTEDNRFSLVREVLIGLDAYDRGEYKTAVEHLEAVVLEIPDSLEHRVVLAKAYREIGNFRRAIHHAEYASGIDPEQVSTYTLLGSLYSKADRPNEAIEAWQYALELRPDMPDVCYRIGRAYEQLDRTQAIEQYESCVVLDPEGEFGKKAQRRVAVLQK